MNLRVVLLNLLLAAAPIGWLWAVPVQAQTPTPVGAPASVWRCGQVFTNQPPPGQTCELLSSVSSTVVEGTRVNAARERPVSPVAPAAPAASGTPRVTVAAANQQARVLLQAELREQEQRWQQLQRQWNQGRPVATAQQPDGSPAYLERVASLQEQLHRTEADLAALRRELARLP